MNLLKTGSLIAILMLSLQANNLGNYKEACRLNDASACKKIGVMYYEGKIVAKDYKKAITFFKKSCELNSSSGCRVLGLMYEQGYGVKRNNKKASEFYKKACNLKDSYSCLILGGMYEGLGLKKDYKKAVEFYKKACELNYDLACKNLKTLNKKLNHTNNSVTSSGSSISSYGN